ncbi:transcription antitermination factor NusB [Geovibrio thiophilus]|uniref:Transcription antitermination protein NusB n=1 Tax=Geovibrio thiophilus TaxID=139438 RepID=A0A3R5UXN5_9BACT|nr:transcription antitermination factor NusB [Geovibrio thiophilus]QAR33065.1 transcription antitermination factor NusB [Geovibrio thiophilus]
MADKSGRTKAREYAFQMMYRYSMTGEAPTQIPLTFWQPLGIIETDVKEFAESLFRGAASKAADSDAMIVKFLKNGWTFDRMGEIEKNIMRVAMFELLDGKSPYFAILDDFVTLTKKFGDETAAGLVNGILDNVRKTYSLSAGENE